MDVKEVKGLIKTLSPIPVYDTQESFQENATRLFWQELLVYGSLLIPKSHRQIQRSGTSIQQPVELNHVIPNTRSVEMRPQQP